LTQLCPDKLIGADVGVLKKTSAAGADPNVGDRVGFFVAWKLDEPLIFESLILEFRRRNSERSTAPKRVESQRAKTKD